MLKDFKTFIMRGNVVDLAVGVIIGTAFGKIINSLVNDVLMPPIGRIVGGLDFKEYKISLGGSKVHPAILNYGNFIQITLEFLIIAFCVYLIVKGVNFLIKKEETKPAPTKEQELLAEIRDLLKKKSDGLTV